MAKQLKPYERLGTPDKGEGVRILSAAELARMIADNPHIQRGIDTINNVEGVPRMIQKIVHEAWSKNKATLAFNKFQIDAQLRKGIKGAMA